MDLARNSASKLKEALSEKTYQHSIRTSETARKIAATFGLDTEKARFAGLFHDCAKDLSAKLLLDFAREYSGEPNEVELTDPILLHAQVGAHLAKWRYGIGDEDILTAIARHTFGSAEMSSLDKVIYIADMIEPGRRFPGVEAIRGLADENLDACYEEAYAHTLEYLASARKPIHPATIEAWNWIVLGGSHD